MTSSSSTNFNVLGFTCLTTITACIFGVFGALGSLTVRLLSDKTGLIATSYCLKPVEGATLWATAQVINSIFEKTTKKEAKLSYTLPISFIVTSLVAGVGITKVSIATAAINALATFVLLKTVGIQ